MVVGVDVPVGVNGGRRAVRGAGARTMARGRDGRAPGRRRYPGLLRGMSSLPHCPGGKGQREHCRIWTIRMLLCRRLRARKWCICIMRVRHDLLVLPEVYVLHAFHDFKLVGSLRCFILSCRTSTRTSDLCDDSYVRPGIPQ